MPPCRGRPNNARSWLRRSTRPELLTEPGSSVPQLPGRGVSRLSGLLISATVLLGWSSPSMSSDGGASGSSDPGTLAANRPFRSRTRSPAESEPRARSPRVDVSPCRRCRRRCPGRATNGTPARRAVSVPSGCPGPAEPIARTFLYTTRSTELHVVVSLPRVVDPEAEEPPRVVPVASASGRWRVELATAPDPV